MLQRFYNLSLQRKQMLIIMLISAVSLLLACAGFVTYDAFAYRRELVKRVSSLAEVIGNNTTAAIDFNDPAAAVQTLAALRAEPNILQAQIHVLSGAEFAAYHRAGAPALPAPPSGAGAYHEFKDQNLRLVRPIFLGNEPIGSIALTADLGEFRQLLWVYTGIVAIVFCAALTVAFFLSLHLGRVITRPVHHLAGVVQAVRREQNYSFRATQQGADELGQLIDGFNGMLAQIQLQDAALQQSRVELEQRVRERTGQLAESLSLTRATLEATSDGVLVADGRGRITGFNERFLVLWNIPRELSQSGHEEGMLAVATKQLKHPEAFRARVAAIYADPEAESFDVVEFASGRVLELSSKPQRLGEQCVGRVWSHRDVTERVRTEDAVRRTEALYRRAISGAGAVPYSNDFRTQSYLFMGEGIAQLIGYAPQEVNGALWGRIVQKSVMLGAAAGLDKAEAARRVLSGELQHWRCDMCVTTRDGRTRWISDASVQDHDELGRPLVAMGILQDITERKQAEIVAVAFSKLGRDLSCAGSREEAARIIGEIADELFGWDAFSLQAYSSQDDTSHVIYEVDTVDGHRVSSKMLASRKATELQHRIFKCGAELILRKPDSFLPGTVAFGNKSKASASLMYVPIRTGTKIVGILTIQSYAPNAYTEQNLVTLQTMADHGGGALERLRADEARRESELQFRQVWDTSADGMRLTDRDGTVLLANEAYCRMIEKPKVEVEGQLLSAIHCPEHAETVLRNYRTQMDQGKTPSHLETEVTLWNGRKVWFELANSILQLTGRPIMLLSIFRDATQRKQAAAELEAVHRQLLNVSRQAGMAEVATGVLHNVGNVLNSVNVASGCVADNLRRSKAGNLFKVVALLREHQTDLGGFFSRDPRGPQLVSYLAQLAEHITEEQAYAQKELAELQKHIDHIKDIVTMQQSFARVSGLTESIQVTELVDDAVRMNESALVRHEVQIIKEYATVPPILVEKHKVLQILVNLVANAKQACEAVNRDSKQLTLSVTNQEDRIHISVADNGVGIPPENLTRIFAHGFTTKKNGHGFGLHSGALAAKEMGGTLRVHSDGIGRGTVFTLELPLKPTKQ